jgi:hypothetical protein
MFLRMQHSITFGTLREVAMILSAVFLLASPAPGTALEGAVLHEWGVVVYRGPDATAVGSPMLPLSYPDDMTAEAPVLYLHGAGFSGDITVVALGAIMNTFPAPDVAAGPGSILGGLGSFIRWEGIRGVPESPAAEAEETLPAEVDGFAWAAPFWRDTEALTLQREDGFHDRFLYYEVDLSGTGFPLPLKGMCDSGETAGEVLLFHRSEDGVTGFELLPGGDPSMAGRTAPFTCSSGEVRSFLDGWTRGVLTPGETEALWKTWEPYILEGDWEGASLAVFPLPAEVVERVSTVIVRSDTGEQVPVRRFFLGMAPML